MSEVLESTAVYVEGSQDLDENLCLRWQAMVDLTAGQWAEILGVPVFLAEDEVDADDQQGEEAPVFEQEDF